MLRYGQFKFGEVYGEPPNQHHHPTLRIEGPDAEDITNQIWAKAVLNSYLIEFNFHKVIDTAQKVKMTDAAGNSVLLPTADRVPFASWFSAATMLHEIMHVHGYDHPSANADISWQTTSNYASSLPHVACWAVMRCSPYGKIMDDLASSPTPQTFPLLGQEVGLSGKM